MNTNNSKAEAQINEQYSL